MIKSPGMIRLGYAFLFAFMAVATTFVDGFVIRPCIGPSQQRPSSISQYAVDPLTTASLVEYSSSLTISEESWRQYVPLVVAAGVILDILLGNPLANMVLKPMKGDQPQEEDEEGATKAAVVNRSKERIDSDKVAREAIDRAQNTLELRRFLDER
jgi:hypothetical protein